MRRLFVVGVLSLTMVLASNTPVLAQGAEQPPDSGAAGDGDPPRAQPKAVSPGAATDPGPAPVAKKKAWPEKMYGLGVSFMFNMVPQFFLRAFFKYAKSDTYGLYEPAFGLHFVYRKKTMDIRVRGMFGFYRLKDGNYLGSGKTDQETDYTEYQNSKFIWVDVLFTWHTKIAKQFYFAYGTGIGLGVVLTKVFTTASYNCNAGNYHDPTVCRPQPDAGAPGMVCDADGCRGLEGHSEREKERIPPVLPAVNAHIGLRWDIFRHLTWRIFDVGIFFPGLFYAETGLTIMF